MSGTRAYRVCGLTVESNIALPELLPADGSTPRCSFHLALSHEERPTASDWFHKWTFPNGEGWLAFARRGRDFLLRFPELSDFLVSADGRAVRCYPQPNTPAETVRHLFLDQVIPLVLSVQGRLVLHASAVLAPEGAIGFVGEAGRGKSTLATSFSQQGLPFLSDDCLVLREEREELVAVPSYPGLRLWPETVSAVFEREPALSQVAHYSAKKRLSPNGELPFSGQPAPLRRLYFLVNLEQAEGTSDVEIQRLSARDALLGVVRYAYLLDIGNRARLRKEFDCVGRVAALPLFYRLAFPRRYELLPKVREAILDNLRAASEK